MSTILKALRRLEEEKAAAEEPRPLREQIATAPLAEKRPRRRGWFGATLALVLGVASGGGLIWWLFPGSSEPIQVAAAAPEPAPAPPPVARHQPEPAPVPAPAPAVPIAGPPEQAFESDVETVERPDPMPRLADDDPVVPARTGPAPGSKRPVESSAAMERARAAARAEMAAAERARMGLPQEMVAPVPATTPEPTPVAEPAVQPSPPEPAPAHPQPKIVAVAPDILVPAPAAPKPAPAPAREARPAAPPEPKAKPPARDDVAASQAARELAREDSSAELPAFSIERTQWHPLADRRVAWLRVPGESEPRRVVEGDVVDGLLVSTIEPSGIVFERDGKKIERVLGKR